MARRTAVYLIWCPDLWPGPCYVGTAVRPKKRFGGHLKFARQGKSTGGADCIRAIWEAGHQSKLMVWKWFDTKREAQEAELRFKELVKSNPRLDLTNRHAGLETAADSEACARGGRKGVATTLALKDADGKSVNARKGGRAVKERFDSDPKFAERMREAGREAGRKGGRKSGRINGRKRGTLYGRDDLVRYIRKQDPGRGSRKPRSRELAVEIERDHGIRVQPRTICRIWRGERYAYVE